MNGHFTIIDTLILVLYFVCTMGIGLASMRKGGTSVEGFTEAKRSFPGWLTGLSILGSFISSISFLALPGKSYASDWNPFVWSLAMPLATWISVKYFVPFYRHVGSVSAYAHLENRFGTWARIYPGVCYLLTQLARIGAVTYLMALPMSVLLDWNIYFIIAVTGLAVTCYTFVGGIVAVIWTNAVQTVVLIVGAVLCAAIMVFSVPDGISGIMDVAMQNNKFSLGSMSLTNLAESTFFVMLVYGLFINLQNFGIDQNYVQTYLTAKSDREAEKGLWIGGMIYLPLSAVFFFIGTALFCYYQAFPNLLPAEYANKPDYVFPYFMVTAIPIGFKGLLIAAIFAAAMSTISTSLTSSATIILTDYYKRYFDKNASERRSMFVLRLTTVIWGALGTLIALAFTKATNALDAWWVLAGIFSGGMLGLFVLGLVSKKAGMFSGALGVIVGVSIIVWMSLAPYVSWMPKCPFHAYLIPVFGTSAVFVVGFCAGQIAYLFRRKDTQA